MFAFAICGDKARCWWTFREGDAEKLWKGEGKSGKTDGGRIRSSCIHIYIYENAVVFGSRSRRNNSVGYILLIFRCRGNNSARRKLVTTTTSSSIDPGRGPIDSGYGVSFYMASWHRSRIIVDLATVIPCSSEFCADRYSPITANPRVLFVERGHAIAHFIYVKLFPLYCVVSLRDNLVFFP